LHQVPVSHGEGRFVAGPDQLEQLIRQDQIATQYVDLEGRPSQLTAYNPNGSVMADRGDYQPGRPYPRQDGPFRTLRRTQREKHSPAASRLSCSAAASPGSPDPVNPV
jgi:hypothetical protein